LAASLSHEHVRLRPLKVPHVLIYVLRVFRRPLARQMHREQLDVCLVAGRELRESLGLVSREGHLPSACELEVRDLCLEVIHLIIMEFGLALRKESTRVLQLRVPVLLGRLDRRVSGQ